MAIDPNETGYILNQDKKFDLSGISSVYKESHIQGIAQLGKKYIVLSTSKKKKELILAYDSGKKKILQVKDLPNEYEHAGGLGVLDVGNKWMIVVPVYKVDQDHGDKGAILRYFLSKKGQEQAKLKCCGKVIDLSSKAYAAGIARNGNSVVIAVVVDGDGNKVQFWTCDDPNGLGNYNPLGDVWNARKVDDKKRQKLGWKPDKKWGKYPNSISLIEHGEQIYFVGMHNGKWGIGKDWVDIYLVNQKAGNSWLIKVDNAHVKCNGAVIDGPSFRWGGNARIQNGILEVLAVERYFSISPLGCNQIMYNKFCFNIIPANHLNPT